jgi:hypothetical protein
MPPPDPLGELLSLFGCEHVRHVGEGLGEAAGRLLGHLELVGPQGLERIGKRSRAAAFTIGASCCFWTSVASTST